MSFWRRSSWQSKPFLDSTESWLLVAGAIFTLCSTVTDPPAKWWWLGAVAVACVAVARIRRRYKRVDDAEKADQASKAAARDLEMAAVRQRAAGQVVRMAEAVLAHMHDHLFGNRQGQVKRKHRVTLFEARAGEDHPSGCKRWLAIYARVGLVSSSTTTWPLDADWPDKCRGVAGKVWFDEVAMVLQAECPWPADGHPDAKRRYASSLNVSIEEAERLNVRWEFFAGTTVRVGSRKWGVLLVDSEEEIFTKKSGSQAECKRRIERYATLLGKLLEEASV